MNLDATNTAADAPETRRYNRIRRWLGVADFVIGLALLVALLVTGWTGTMRDLAWQGAFEHYSLALFLYITGLLLLSKLLTFGLEYYSFRIEHSYHLSNQRLRSWLWDQAKGWLLELGLATLLIEVLYYTIRESPEHWWLIAWAAFIGLFIFFAQIAPVVFLPLFYKFEPLENDQLKQRLVRLSERAGTRVRGVYEWKLSEKSKKANAALTGLGATRRIILADNLLQNYSEDEIEAVLAHELGHHVHRHILKSIALQVGITFFGFWAASFALHYSMERLHIFETLSDFANLPLLVLVSTVMSFLLMPVLNAYSRFNERQADRYCFASLSSVQPFISSMNKLAQQNMAERSPARWVEWFFDSHPAIAKRVAAAEAWANVKPASS
jgi:STE24 endopeptidase